MFRTVIRRFKKEGSTPSSSVSTSKPIRTSHILTGFDTDDEEVLRNFWLPFWTFHHCFFPICNKQASSGLCQSHRVFHHGTKVFVILTAQLSLWLMLSLTLTYDFFGSSRSTSQWEQAEYRLTATAVWLVLCLCVLNGTWGTLVLVLPCVILVSYNSNVQTRWSLTWHSERSPPNVTLTTVCAGQRFPTLDYNNILHSTPPLPDEK